MIRLRFSLPVLGILLMSGAAMQAKTFPLTASQGAPAASGKVDAGKDKNGNTEVTISAEHLARPGSLTPAATAYVVWFQGQGNQPVNEGQIKVGKDLKGDYKTTTRFQNFDVFVTAESDPQVTMPSGQTVLSTKVQAVD